MLVSVVVITPDSQSGKRGSTPRVSDGQPNVINSCRLMGAAKVKRRRRGDMRTEAHVRLTEKRLELEEKNCHSTTTFAGYGTTFLPV